MKNFLVLFSALLLVSCEETGKLTRDDLNLVSISQNLQPQYTGVFSPTSGITVSGIVKIYRDVSQRKLKLENFSISDGPDLKVYLSKTGNPNEFVTLGNLNPTSTYLIPASIDFSEYKFVLIHCQQYNHLFATAQLTSN